MSYDLYLRDPVDQEVLTVPGHMMYGPNIPCNYVDGQFIPIASTEAYLNITYNYSPYYHEAFPGNKEDPEQHNHDVKKFNINPEEGGIRAISGVSGAEAIQILREMIRRITKKYKNTDGSWIVSERKNRYYVERSTGKRMPNTWSPLDAYFQFRRQGLSQAECEDKMDQIYEGRDEMIYVDEGSNGDDYWTPTAANAIRPLHQLIALSQLRPDGVWSEES